jgi:hypothetical protein
MPNRVTDTAYDLHNYIQWRARHEGVGYSLSPEFFRAAIDAGTTSFFGVEIGESGLVGDSQQPDLFRQWQAQQ